MFDVLVETLISQMLVNWSKYPTVKWTKPNSNFSPPPDGIWVRVQVDSSYSRVDSICENPLLMQSGFITFQCFIKENKGTGDIKAFTDSLASYFALYHDSNNLILSTPTTRHVGAINGWYQVNVLIPYDIYQHKDKT